MKMKIFHAIGETLYGGTLILAGWAVGRWSETPNVALVSLLITILISSIAGAFFNKRKF